MKTICTHCIFAKRKDYLQVGCVLNRLDKFPKTLVGLSYELEGFCNSCRTPYWESYIKHQRINDELLSDLSREVCVKYSVLVYYDGNEDALRTTLKSAMGEFSPSEVIVCMESELQVNCAKVYDDFCSEFKPLYITQSIDNPYRHSLHKCNGQFLYFMDAGLTIDKQAIKYLNSMINEQIKPVQMIAAQTFTICSKQLYSNIPDQDDYMSALYLALKNSEKLKDTVIDWPLK